MFILSECVDFVNTFFNLPKPSGGAENMRVGGCGQRKKIKNHRLRA